MSTSLPSMSSFSPPSPTAPSVICGNGGGADTYFHLRIIAIFVILCGSMFGALFPILVKNSKSLQIPQAAFECDPYFSYVDIIHISPQFCKILWVGCHRMFTRSGLWLFGDDLRLDCYWIHPFTRSRSFWIVVPLPFICLDWICVCLPRIILHKDSSFLTSAVRTRTLSLEHIRHLYCRTRRLSMGDHKARQAWRAPWSVDLCTLFLGCLYILIFRRSWPPWWIPCCSWPRGHSYQNWRRRGQFRCWKFTPTRSR